MGKKLFIINTSEGCGACNVYKAQYHKDIISYLSMKENIEVHHLNIDHLGKDPGENYHPQFRSARKSYPGFYLFEMSDFYSFDKDLKGKMMDGTFRNGEIIKDGTYNFRSDKLIDWLDKNLEEKENKINGSVFFEFHTMDWYDMI